MRAGGPKRSAKRTGELLIAQQDNEMPVPDLEHLGGADIVDRQAQIDADDLGAERRRQGLYADDALRRVLSRVKRPLQSHLPRS
jgi:hypothetical protein